jgi:hypothetical protein
MRPAMLREILNSLMSGGIIAEGVDRRKFSIKYVNETTESIT